MRILKQLSEPFFYRHGSYKFLNLFLLLILVFGIVNFSTGLYQAFTNHGDLSLIVKHNQLTLYTPEIYNNPENAHGIRYPINSAIVMAPVFAFYGLGENLIYFYLILMFAAVVMLPWLLTTGIGLRLDNDKINWRKIIFAIVLATAATRVTLNVGQVGIILFALLLLSFYLSSDYPKLAAILLAIAISKPQLGLFFFIFMVINAPLITSIIAAFIHAAAHVIFCYLHDLNILATIRRWVTWQLEFKDHAIIDNTGYVNSMHSIDIVNLLRGLNFPDVVVVSVFTGFILLGLILLYLNRHDHLAQFAILCIWPLFLFYHRPYDYFLLWGMVPLLLQNRDHSWGLAALKILAIGVLIVPYIPTFGFMTEHTELREIFYFTYTALVLLLLLSVTLVSKRNLAMGYRET